MLLAVLLLWMVHKMVTVCYGESGIHGIACAPN